jgi:formate hydrogenlyase subunit 3/multisubunit Na+/H+ antiporter MnhD subunit
MSLEGALLLLAVLAPFLGTVAIILLRRRPNPREAASLATSVLSFSLVAALLPSAFEGATPAVVLLTAAPRLEIVLRADLLGLLFASVASLLWILTTIYSIGYMRGLKEHAQTRYYVSFAFVMGATMGIALSDSLFSLLVFYEILTVSTYPLVIHQETEEAYRAGRKYLVYTLGGGGAVLAALAIAYGLGGDVSFVVGGNPALLSISTGAARAVSLLLIAGFGVKATLVPLHGWLPSAMVAPTPVSGLLHAVAVVKAGVFGLLRTLFYFIGPGPIVSLGVQPLLLGAAALTILIGSLLALVQDDLKLRLAYSTISQLSYIILGAALLTPAGLLGAAFHIAAHGFAKLTMFFVAGSILVHTGKTRVSELDGIGKQMPGTMIAFALAALAMASLPPMAPFVSKWYISVGAWEVNQAALVLVLVTSSVLNIAYFFPIVMRAFFGGSPGTVKEGALAMYGPIVATAAGALLLGVWTAMPYGPFEIARVLARGALP